MNELLLEKAKLLGSFILFTQVFYKLRTGREFEISKPTSRESHHITVAKVLARVLRGNCKRLIINIPPRYGKTEMLIQFIGWALAHYPDSNFLYISYSHTLAKKQTQTVKQLITLPVYRKLFGVELSSETSAKDNFETNAGGSVYAAGAGGTITGRGAGIQNCQRFGGAIIIDDIHKPSEVTSDTMRQSVNDWYKNTLQSRVNSPDTPIIFIGQRLHEDDLAANLLEGFDGNAWETVILPALDEAKCALHPAMHSKEQLLKMQETMPYEYSSQYQQKPQPAGGGIFKSEWFVLLDDEPEFLATFITADTAETDKTYNDPTVFSFWGIYKIYQNSVDTGLLGLHWIDCREEWIEAKDLEDEFLDFWASCRRHPMPPKTAGIEKKSTGVTLSGALKKVQGLRIIDIERTKASGSKTARYIEMQPYVASKQISLPTYGKHTQPCIEHMKKITANDTHRHDDRCDTAYDAVKLTLIDKIIYAQLNSESEVKEIVKSLNAKIQQRQNSKARTSWHNR